MTNINDSIIEVAQRNGCDQKTTIVKTSETFGKMEITAETKTDKRGDTFSNVTIKLTKAQPKLAEKLITTAIPYFEDPWKQLDMPFEVTTIDEGE